MAVEMIRMGQGVTPLQVTEEGALSLRRVYSLLLAGQEPPWAWKLILRMHEDSSAAPSTLQMVCGA